MEEAVIDSLITWYSYNGIWQLTWLFYIPCLNDYIFDSLRQIQAVFMFPQ